MRIGYDGKKAVRNLTGIGNYSRRVINAVCSSAYIRPVLFTAEKGCEQALGELSDSVEIVRPGRWLRHGLLREWWRCYSVCRRLKKERIDIYHGLSNELPFGIARSGCRSVVTIHDLIFLRHPETFGWLARRILKHKTRYACRVADRVIAISENTKHDIMAFYGTPANKIEVLYQSISPRYFQQVSDRQKAAIRETYQLPRRFVLCVGTIQDRKNQACLVRALPLLPEDVKVVLIGRATRYQDEVVVTAHQQGVADRLMILNSVRNDDLPAIYQTASVFCLMSIYEGFGLPIAEALASGVPVIAAKGSCLEEAGGPDSIYINACDHRALADAVLYVLSDSAAAQRMADSGKVFAERFKDQEMTRRLATLYRRLSSINR